MIKNDDFDVFFEFFIEKLDMVWNYTLENYIQLSFIYILIKFK